MTDEERGPVFAFSAGLAGAWSAKSGQAGGNTGNIKPAGKKEEADNEYIYFEDDIADLKIVIIGDQRSRDRDQDHEDKGKYLYPDQGSVRFPDVMHLLVLDDPEYGEEHKAQDVVIELQHHTAQDFPDVDLVHFLSHLLRYHEIESQKGHGNGIDTVRQGFDPCLIRNEPDSFLFHIYPPEMAISVFFDKIDKDINKNLTPYLFPTQFRTKRQAKDLTQH